MVYETKVKRISRKENSLVLVAREEKEKNLYSYDLTNIPTYLNIQKRKPLQWIAKRLIDIVGSIAGIIVLFPFFLLLSIAIKLESKGPVLFKQKRIGLDGKPFFMYKFRSMELDAQKKEDQVKKMHNQDNMIMFKIKNDPRVTNIGRIIRKYSIDEFPQLLNVLRGEMSLVGPRPRVPKDLRYFKSHHYVFFATLPGMTGMWQANGRSAIKDFEKVVSMEYDYLTNWNFFTDIFLVLKTVPVVLFAKNTA